MSAFFRVDYLVEIEWPHIHTQMHETHTFGVNINKKGGHS